MEVHHYYCSPLHAHNGDEKKGFINNKYLEASMKKKCGKNSLDPIYWCCPTNLWKWWCLDGVKPTPCQCHIPSEIFIYSICLLHMWVGIVREFMQASNCGYFHMHLYYPRRHHWILWNMVWIWVWRVGCHVCKLTTYFGWWELFQWWW